jgi:hypothetical protein
MTDCFDCLEPANYAAVALKLQSTALQAEACLFDIEKVLRNAVNLPTLIRTSTATQGISNGQVATLAGTGSTTITFANSSYTAFNQVLPAGVWLVGAYINPVATGGVDDNTYRQLTICTRIAFSPSSTANIYTFTETQFEANVGNGVDMLGCTTLNSTGTNELLTFQLIHANASSSLAVQIGAIYWAHRLSDQVALKTV